MNIIQHAGGGPKQLAFFHNTAVVVGGDRVQYLTDSLPGSSGSPVFDKHAIHARYLERFALGPYGSINGSVVDPAGVPISGVKIHVASMGTPEDATRPSSMETSA